MPNELETTLAQLRRDLTACQVRVTEAMNQLGNLNLPAPDEHRCPNCGVKTRGPLALAEHQYTSHAGTFPPHYARAEQLAGLAEA